MPISISKSLALTAFIFAASAHASIITFDAAYSTAAAQSSAEAYKTVVNAAVGQTGAKHATVSTYNNLSNSAVFGGSNSNLAYRFTVNFDVSAANAGNWGLRAGTDFGKGGAVFLDGLALGFKSNDMWWNGSYSNTNQAFVFSNISLTEGLHTLQIFGLENCCDGGQQAQFNIKGAGYRTIAANDGLSPALQAANVPEPASMVLVLAALGGMALVTRRGGRNSSR
ncbi:CCXG family PEP-CTERM protein [Roseateles koreensis]|uniref:CCXG family PEP-CTERM protein n=1 Tax=Roseateles koreensis TaxID=2987526 RepID=A0ABT5KLJ4_9BURK|nr:CCXG family PEP-CTERM protein [Roseateles koreensis]MDC8783782.1 CCXG family PEP-CTERM protein [Roseateles koreensis]